MRVTASRMAVGDLHSSFMSRPQGVARWSRVRSAGTASGRLLLASRCHRPGSNTTASNTCCRVCRIAGARLRTTHRHQSDRAARMVQ